MKISPIQYAKTLVALSKEEGDVSRTATAFLSFIRKRRGTRKLAEIIRAAERLSDGEAGRMALLAETAVPADDAMKKEIGRVAAEAFPGFEAVIRYVVRPDLLGGLRLSSEDEVVDGSVRARLRAMEERMKGR